MTLTLIALGVMGILSLGYLAYGRFVAHEYRLDPSRTTPAVARNDGIDFVPTRPFYLMGQHFSAIAAAGPIVGPIAACLAFGWLPCLLWIVVGVVLIGAVHDFSALVASVRHDASSVAELARRNLGRRAWLVLTIFIYIALLYVIVAFTDVTAQTFRGVSEELSSVKAELGGRAFSKGGAVASASVLYLLLALVMGLVQRYTRLRGWVLTLTFVPATLGVVFAGTFLSTALHITDARWWHLAILIYCFIASLLPLWLLQQPRGYLGGWVLYLACAVGLLGVIFGGFDIKQPMLTTPEGGWSGAYRAFFTGAQGAPPFNALIFPFLFVTIACGACSGFHGLICGGTTSKQIASETHCKPVAFGAMLLEGLVAVIALSTVMIVAKSDVGGRAAGVLYGDGLATYITRFLDPDAVESGATAQSRVFLFAATFGAMAFSTFVFDTLDVSCRLGRYLLAELTGWKSRAAGVCAAAVTAGVPLVALATTTDPQAKTPGWMLFWTLFGASNQLLASMTLLGVFVWLRREGRRAWYVFYPMLFVMGVTVSALLTQLFAGARATLRRARDDDPATSVLSPELVNALAATVLLALAAVFIHEAVKALRHRPLDR